ncbi:hypothetical protein ACH47Z_05945 [Streptomyces sp. NPDC020192]|uniref:hypothetical protein n=1 Tax=Streptomyces sp. NPDC020192 TaxID=3365066 RepID=UPI0037A8F0A1
MSDERVDELGREISRIADLVLRGTESADEEIRAFNARTGHGYAALDFAGYHGSRDLADFAREAARPARPRIADITRDELVEIVRRLLAGTPESDHHLRLLEANVPHPRGGGLLLHPPADLRNASAEQITDRALGHRPIAL